MFPVDATRALTEHPAPRCPFVDAPDDDVGRRHSIVHDSSRVLFTVFGAIYDALTDHPLAAQNAALLDRCGPLPDDARVLDIGCGTGIGTVAIAKRLAPRATVVGVDLTAAMVTRATARLDADVPNVSFAQADATAMPQLPSQHFDAVLANSFLYLVPRPALVLRELHRVLKAGGRVVIMEPHTDGSWRRTARRSLVQHASMLPTHALSSARLGPR